MPGPDKQKRRRGKDKEDQNRQDASASGYKPHRSLLINNSDETPVWYNIGSQIPGRNETIFDVELPSNPKNSTLVSKYRSLAEEIFRIETSLMNGKLSGDDKPDADARWVENTMKKGTLKDRIAATSVVISTDPVHKVATLDSLLAMAGCTDAGQTNSRVAQMAAEAIEDLFLNTLLPPNRKLLTLDQRPFALYEVMTKKTLSPRVLLLWRYEEILKERYEAFLTKYLVKTLKDGMELNKTLALRTAGSLLRSTPEGEEQLLSMMVNKIGDPAKKIAASAGHELRRVLEQHDNMQPIVAREVQQLAHRPHLSTKALYNCIVFLNQLKFRAEPELKGSSETVPLAVSLVNTYFRMFDVAVKKQSDEKVGMKSRLLSALLTGINRAHGFLPDKDQGLEEHMDSLYNVSHTAPPSASTQALMLLFHVAVGQPTDTKQSEEKQKKQSRFYRAVYAKLSDQSFLTGGRHITMFFNLLYKAMKYDIERERVLSFAKRLVCTSLHASPPIAAASLFLVNEVMKTHHFLTECFINVPDSDSAAYSLDPSKRDPRSAIINLESSKVKELDVLPPMWEMTLLSNHYHPSVGKFATSLGSIEYFGDPLRDFTLAPFLDKFSYKNAKTHKKTNMSVAQRRIESQGCNPLNDPQFLRKENVDAADKFFHHFFVERARRDIMNGVVRRNGTQQDDAEAEDEAFDMVEQHQIDHVFHDGDSVDPEEEEFVDKLAMNLMKTAGDGPADFDEEDPDMDDWDGHSKTDVDHDSISAESVDDVNGEQGANVNLKKEAEVDEGSLMDGSDYEDSDLLLSRHDDSDEEDYTDDKRVSKRRKASVRKVKRKSAEDIFADADDYENVIQKAVQERKIVSKPFREAISSKKKRLRKR